MMRIGAILAGGQSRRMGAEKATLQLNGARLVDHVYRRLRAQVDCVVISGVTDYDLGLEIVADEPGNGRGPAAGVLSVSSWVGRMHPAVKGFVTVPIDGPFLPEDLVARLMSEVASSIAVTDDGPHPTFGFWVRDDIQKIRGEFLAASPRSLKRLASLVGATPVQWNDAALFTNINTPSELEGVSLPFE